MSPDCMPGVANHSAIIAGTPITYVAASHGLRRPPASAMAPRTGAVRATMIAPTAVMKLQRACPSTPFELTAVVK